MYKLIINKIHNKVKLAFMIKKITPYFSIDIMNLLNGELPICINTMDADPVLVKIGIADYAEYTYTKIDDECLTDYSQPTISKGALDWYNSLDVEYKNYIKELSKMFMPTA